MSFNLYDHILGGLLGQALGDAWGMPAYLSPEDTWEKYGGWVDRFYPGPEDHPVHGGLQPGQVTDDTEQAFALADSIIERGGVTIEGVAEAVLKWYEAVGGDTSPYVGPSTTRAVQALRRRVSPYKSGLHGDTNGAAMRVSPVGLIHPGDPERAVRDAALSCIPTHNTDVATSGAAAVAGAIAQALTPETTLERIVVAGQDAAVEGRRHGERWMGASISWRIGQAVEVASSDKPVRKLLRDLYDIIGTSLAMTEAVPAAFGVLVLAEGDPLQAAIYAANLSGDADTVGAMACTIAGAWKGAKAFSSQVIATLKEANPELDFEGVARGLEEIALKNMTAGNRLG